jgi:hypothetical protein
MHHRPLRPSCRSRATGSPPRLQHLSSRGRWAHVAVAVITTRVRLSAARKAELATETKFAQCLRDHGLEGHPDPQVSNSGYLLTGVPFGADEGWQKAQGTRVSATDDAARPDDTDTDAAGWERVKPGDDRQCSDGFEFSFWVRKADPKKVAFYLQSGGGCFSAGTCDPDRELYTTAVGDGPTPSGVYDFANPDNPLAEYSVVYVPYCTGDVHLGHATRTYAPGLTIHYEGYRNGTAALDHLTETFPDATDVVVVREQKAAEWLEAELNAAPPEPSREERKRASDASDRAAIVAAGREPVWHTAADRWTVNTDDLTPEQAERYYVDWSSGQSAADALAAAPAAVGEPE